MQIDIVSYAATELGVREGIAAGVVEAIASRKEKGWSTEETVERLAVEYDPTNPAARRSFVQDIRDRIN